MNKKVKIGNKGSLTTITDKQYVTAGGEANIYKNGGMIYKLYHDPSKKALPLQKIQELARITNANVITPKEVIYDAATGEPLGYTAPYVDNVEPLLKLFTRTFKQDNNIDPQMISELVKQLQLATTDIHGASCLIVDFNELNVLVNVGTTNLIPWFIDTDSYATPSYKATAIMDSVRDRRVSSLDNAGKLVYKPDELSDWYSWAILSFWLYSNIHPFRGTHPNYKPKDKQKQFDDGVSVFHKGVRVPPSVNNFSVIPKRHFDWFQDVFLNNNRSIPPLADSIVPLTVPNTIVLVKGTHKVDVIQLDSYSDDIITVQQFMGVNYVITNKHIYSGQIQLSDCKNAKKTFVVPSTDGTMVCATLQSNRATFTELNTGKPIDVVATTDMFVRNNCIYTVCNGKLIESSFTTLGNKTVTRIKEVENVSNYATIHNGCVLQDLLGKPYLTIPHEKGACFSKHVPQLEKYRIISCKSERNVTVIIGEKNGVYDKFIIVFNKTYTDFDVRIVTDVSVDTINFTVMANGLCALLNEDGDMELFVNNQKVEVLENAPFDSSMKLFNTTDGIFFINRNSIHQVKRK